MRGQERRARNELIRFPSAAEEAEDTEAIHWLGIWLITLLASLVGIWGLVCLLSGLMHSSGPGGLGTGWVSAVLGL